MLSGTGRHRRPKQAPALLLAVGVTGAGMALPLLASGSASAVSDGTWDRAAKCESGGDWHLNTGNGYYGGFQLTLRMWEQYGGLEFAVRPDLATREQQISVVERLLADQGSEGLPGCSLLSGLWGEFRYEQEQAQEQAEQEQGDGEAEESAPAEDSAQSGQDEQEAERGERQEEQGQERQGQREQDGAQSGSGDASGADGEAGGVDEGGSTGQAGGSSGSPAEGTGRHRGAPDPAEAEGDEGSASADGPNTSTDEVRRVERGAYEVRRGDMLSAIAADLDVPGGWPALYQENKSVIGDDPDYILPGQLLDVPVTGR